MVLSPIDASIPIDCWLFNPKLVMVKIKIYPLVNVYVTMERSTILKLGKSTISVAMASIAIYVCLPEGN